MNADKYSKDLGPSGRAMGFAIGLFLSLGGLLSLGICAVCLYVRATGPSADNSLFIGAGIAGVFALLLGGYGGDMLYRAISDAVPAERFFDGKLGTFRASLGLFFSLFLALSMAFSAIAIVTSKNPFPPGTRVIPFVTMAVLSGVASWKCGSVLFTKMSAPPVRGPLA